MKISKSLHLAVLSLVCFAIPVAGHCQVYTLSTPISGWLTMSAWDENGPAGSSGSFNYNFTNLTETVYLDPVAETIRQIAVISGTPTATNISIQETQSIPGQFPNPPTNVSGSVTVTLAPSGGALTYDTGPLPLTWNAGSGAYTFDGSVLSWGNIVGSYSLVTGGQTNSGSFNYGLVVSPASYPWMITFNTVSTAGYPTKLSLNGLGNLNSLYGTFVTTVSPVVHSVANDGFDMELSIGVFIDYGVYHDERAFWLSLGTITATLVPTTNSPTITGQPQSVTVHSHDTASFNVTPSGTVPLSYQWSLNGTNISGATLSSLTIANVVQTNLGVYAVVVTNGIGSVTSSNTVLSMYPFIATPFLGAVTYWGKPASFDIEAWGTGLLGYQWYQDGVAILNVNTQTLSFTSIQATNAGLYSVVVTSSLGSVTNGVFGEFSG